MKSAARDGDRVGSDRGGAVWPGVTTSGTVMPRRLVGGYDKNPVASVAMDDNRTASAPASPAARQQDRPPRERGQGIPLGRLAGVPIYLAPSWLLLAVLITLTYGQYLASRQPELPRGEGLAISFGFVVCLLVSVLLHELGHAVTSRRSGIGVRGIRLEMLGGYTEMEREAPRPGIELYVSLSGPVVSLVVGLLAAAAALVLPYGSIAATFAVQLALSNIVVAVFNALPGLPLDGGRALQALVWKVSGDANIGRRVAGWVGRVLALGTAAAALALFQAGVIALYGMVFTLLVAVTMWVGAGQAIRHARAAGKSAALQRPRAGPARRRGDGRHTALRGRPDHVAGGGAAAGRGRRRRRRRAHRLRARRVGAGGAGRAAALGADRRRHPAHRQGSRPAR